MGRQEKIQLPRGAVGRELTSKVPTVLPDTAVGEIRETLPKLALSMDSIDYVYVLNERGRLVGIISLKELTGLAEAKTAKEIMTRELVVSHPQVKKVRVAHLAIKHNIKAVPIVDAEGKFLGVMQSDKLLQTLYDEHRQSANRNAGIINLPQNFGSMLDSGIWNSFISRLPWILIGLVGGVFAAQIIEFFDGILSDNVVLAAFIPLVVYVSSAVGTQTQTFFVRDIAFDQKLKIIPYVVKQLAVTALIGAASGVFTWGLITLIWNSSFLGLIIGVSSFMAIISSAFISVFVPYTLFATKHDPASGGGPFATILQDLLSVVVYFLVASALL